MSHFWGNLTSAVFFHVIPAFLTYQAAISPTAEGTRKWLTFWVVHAFVSVVELLGDVMLSHSLVYCLAKVCCFFWLVFLDGSAVLYRLWLRDALQAHSADIDRGMEAVQSATASGAMQLAYAALQRLNPQQLLSAGLWATTAGMSAAAQAPLPPLPAASLPPAGSSAPLAASTANVSKRRGGGGGKKGSAVLSPDRL
jgi:hypothetical protein